MPEQYDAIVIGTGQAGPPLAVRLATAGRKTAIIERKLVGGTCVNAGCIPTKTLIASARAAYVARRCADFGVRIDGTIDVDMPRVKARKDGVVQQSNQGVTGWIGRTPNLTLLRGHAQFEGPHRVRVGDASLEAPQIFINVGGRPTIPDFARNTDVPYLTSTGMLGVDFLPEHLLIVGASYIGLEFAQMYRRFGSRVTVIEMGPRIIAREDDEVSIAIQQMLEAEGIEFRVDAKCIAIAKESGAGGAGGRVGVRVRVSCAAEPKEFSGSHLLLAVGRTPNTNDLGLERAGIAVDARGYIAVDDELRTGVEGVWALGDANGRGAFTHTSYNDFEIVAANLLDGQSRRVTDRIPVYGLFVDPPLGRVGKTEREVRASGRPALVGKMLMTRVGRARERSETTGFMQVLVDAQSRKILGAALFGTEGDEAVHCIIDIMAADAPYTTLQRAMHIHPTVSELLPTLLGDLKPLV